MLMVAYVFLQEKCLGKSGEARNRICEVVLVLKRPHKANEADEAKN